MNQELGIAFCGLACCVCSENSDCPGCREAGCRNHNICKNYNCCREQGLYGCWECKGFPCADSMLDNRRIRAFAKFAKAFGAEQLHQCLKRNQNAGICYHYPGKYTGDYDIPATEDEIIKLIRNGK